MLIRQSLTRAALGIAAVAAPLWSQSRPDPVPEARTRLERFLAEQHVPGASVAVAVGGRIVWSEGFGFANLEHRVPATPETRFRIGSISKTLTSIAVARLWEQGKLDLDAPVQRYAPTFPVRDHPITTRQLAGHLSGLPHYTAADVVNAVHYETVTKALDKFKDRPLLFAPGERYSYSSYGWNLISVVVEGASGENFLDYMRRQVFEPLGMTNTMADQYDQIIERRTAFYQVRPDGRTLNGPAVDNSDVWAGGGFLSTAEDLVRFAHGVATGPIVKSDTRAVLWTPMKTNDGQPTKYGLGWQVEDTGVTRVVGHGGSHVGATADLVLLPESDVVVAILTNANNRGLSAVSRAIATLFKESGAR